MAKENDVDRTPEPSPDDLGPGAAGDTLLERTTGAHPGEVVPGQAHAVPASESMVIDEEHEPSEHSYYPVLTAVAVLIVGLGFLTHLAVTGVGAIVLLAAIVGWFVEPWVS